MPHDPDLRECPFCGGDAAMRRLGDSAYVECEKCEATGPAGENVKWIDDHGAEVAADLWNERPTEDDLRLMHERLLAIYLRAKAGWIQAVADELFGSRVQDVAQAVSMAEEFVVSKLQEVALVCHWCGGESADENGPGCLRCGNTGRIPVDPGQFPRHAQITSAPPSDCQR